MTRSDHSPAPPAILVSYVYWAKFQTMRGSREFRDIAVDSGAFSAWKSGHPLRLDQYIGFAQRVRRDPKVVEVIALDVIGDGRASLLNALEMKRHGIEVVPVFHIGDDPGILREYCSTWDKVGLSCRFGEPTRESFRWLDRVFADRWPHRFHSFGWMEPRLLLRYPFQSADSSTWDSGVTCWGQWRTFGKLSVPGSNQNLRVEVDHYLRMEDRVRTHWSRTFAAQGWKPPTLRLAAGARRFQGFRLW